VQEFVEWGKQQRQGVSWASPVPGSMPHFIGTEFARMTGLSMSHIPYRGAAPAVSDLLGGTIDAVLVPLGEVTAFHRAGDARILAVSARERLPKLSSVPTLAESGFPSLVHEEWYGVVLPAGARPETLSSLHRSIAEAAASPHIVDALARIDIAPFTMEPEAYRERIAQEAATWGPIVAASGFQPDD
jgi:tripartite-type tricarboxylate transporter receptor subunit TctC